jgi:UDP-N-acetylglucosamine diphosphorylase / glucose-1-phosphate thymidylyltransferase / UDP-N-acetylgalactosamine diphosphorylase / glucosamine-1-phosphate N-acetyltransferase / galactosamine-1-phosphate N-acetyltransferase
MTKKNTKVLIPMAGLGNRFKKAGYEKPKPFIDVNGQKMINIVLNDIISKDCEEAILVSLAKNNAESEINDLNLKNKNAKISVINLEKLTEGALQTILAAEDEIKDCSLILSNCDQKVNFDVDNFINECDKFDGGLVTFYSQNPHHSYVQTSDGIITNIIEKEVISDQAVTGVYYIKNSNEFIEAAKSVIKFNKKEKGEFYVSSAIQLLIYKGLKLISYDAESIMLGTPEELNQYLNKQ